MLFVGPNDKSSLSPWGTADSPPPQNRPSKSTTDPKLIPRKAVKFPAKPAQLRPNPSRNRSNPPYHWPNSLQPIKSSIETRPAETGQISPQKPAEPFLLRKKGAAATTLSGTSLSKFAPGEFRLLQDPTRQTGLVIPLPQPAQIFARCGNCDTQINPEDRRGIPYESIPRRVGRPESCPLARKSNPLP